MRDPRPWTHAAVFGALWGAVEATAGTVLHLARVPLSGLALGLIALVVLVTLRRLQDRVGVCLLAGVVAAFLKVFTLGGLYPGPVIGILTQACAVELAMTVLGSRAIAAIAGGAAALAAGPLQKVAMTWIVAGGDTVRAVLAAADTGLGRLGLGSWTGARVLILATFIAAAIGGAGGLAAWRTAGHVARRLGRTS